MITAARITTLLRGHVRTAPFDEAVRRLTDHHLLVLTGDEGVGKRVGALAILAAVSGPGLSVTSLPPSRTLIELAGGTFQPGRGYLVRDWIGDRSSSALQQFDVDQLRRALERPRHGAYLVLTCQLRPAQRQQLADVIVDWTPPPPVAVFDAHIRCAGIELAPDQGALMRERIVDLRRPRDVVAVAERAGQGVDAAFAVLGEADHQQVVDWFDRKPEPRPLLSVAALCFLDRTPDLLFQNLLSRLVVRVNEHAAIDSVTRTPTATAAGGAFPQQASSELALDTVVIGGSGDTGGHRIRTFASPHHHERVIAELVRQYGFELWEPMRIWIDEVAALPSSPIQVPLAFGVALLGRHAPDEVESFLEEWSNGLAPQRLTAAYILSWMCLDDTLAAMALRIAQRWTSGAGTRRAATAAMAFAGELGIRYQNEALNKLWHLALRVVAVSDGAAAALGVLLCS
ncbi:MAG TPA: hypothetical protein VH352_16625, partial [Pseudonocardiaceae bacterium]|nr:hypothetical protein [Pseudonocardiaceae bacterium]